MNVDVDVEIEWSAAHPSSAASGSACAFVGRLIIARIETDERLR